MLLHMRRGLIRLVKRMLYRPFEAGKPLATVLVFRSGRLGDFLNAVPALRLLRARLPEARIILVTTVSSVPAMQSLTRTYADLNALPWLEFVCPSVVDRTVCFTMTGRWHGLEAMRRTLAEEHPDVLFVLPYMGEPLGTRLKKLLFFRLAGYRGSIFGFDALPSRGSLQQQQYQLGLYEHAVMGPVRALGECSAIGPATESELELAVSVPAAAVDWAGEKMRAAGMHDTVTVALSPGASFAHKVWPVDRFLFLGETLIERYDCRLVVLGGASDRPLGAALQARFGARCLDLTGDTSVTQLAAVLARCQLFAGNDSGVAHLASAVGCPAVTVTSAIDCPGMWEPWNSRGGAARVRIACEYCVGLTACPLGTNACIQAVATEDVLRLCAQALEGRPAAVRTAW